MCAMPDMGMGTRGSEETGVKHRLATSAGQVRRHRKGLGPNERDTGRSRLLLSCGCDSSRYY